MFSDNIDTRKIQESSLDILKALAKVCDENGLTYYLTGGTLLGAVRHKGFIPWDDDIDIAMPRDDYEKLIEIADEKLPPRFKLAHYTELFIGKKPLMHHVQILDQDVTLTRKWAKSESQVHTWIDIFALDGMPKGKTGKLLHYYHFKFWYVLMQISWFEYIVNLSKPNRPLLEKIVIKFISATHFGSSWDTVKLIRRLEKISMKYPFENSDTIVSLYGSFQKKEMIPRRWFEQRILMTFEDAEFYAPSEYDEELTHYYGDYMTPPKTRAEKEDHHKIQVKQ